ncbi:MAG: AAA family ATPase, partial [Solobacterium sp.]|nr:AAA family ATPase [Solobacterium sp.]
DAQPPGKSVQNNMLFSGGEKSLIALCVLFAILKVKPVPMVILDEVEAALDQSNVERFAQYLHRYTDRTQFIVVTHRPGTMENADVLYGVTMQHQGVSQMLKVEIRDALNYADKETEAQA